MPPVSFALPLSIAVCLCASGCTRASPPAEISSSEVGEVANFEPAAAVDPPSDPPSNPPSQQVAAAPASPPWAYQRVRGFAPEDYQHERPIIIDASDANTLLAELEPDHTTPLVFSAKVDGLCEVAEVLHKTPHGPISAELFGDPSSADPSCLTKLDPAYLSYAARARPDPRAQQRAFFTLTRAVPKLRGLGYNGYGGTVHDKPTLTSEDLADLAALHDLQAVALLDVRLDRTTVEALVRLPDLRSLDLDGKAELTLEQLRILADGLELWRFACSGCQLGDEGMGEIAKFEQLRSLLLDGGKLSDRGMQHLVALPELEILDLTRNTSVTNAGVAHLAGLSKMRRLWLSTLAIDSQALPHLRGLTKLELLHLDRTSIGDENFEIVATMTDLRDLNLWSTEISNAGASQLEGLGQLTKLSLEGTKIDSGALASIAKLVALRELQLDDTSIDDGLAQLGSLTQLEYLGLSSTEIDDDDLRRLPLLPRLRKLDASYTDVSEEFANKISTETFEVLVAGECSG